MKRFSTIPPLDFEDGSGPDGCDTCDIALDEDRRTFLRQLLVDSGTLEFDGLYECALGYLDRAARKTSDLIAQSSISIGDSTSPLLCAKRMFLAAVIIAWKFHVDDSPFNDAWATISHFSLEEVCRSEHALLVALEYDLWQPPEKLNPVYLAPEISPSKSIVSRNAKKASKRPRRRGCRQPFIA